MGESKVMDRIGQKVGAATSGGTFLTGLGTYMEILPGLMGVLASAAGIVLSIVVIYCTITKGRLERRILQEKIDRIERTPPERGGKGLKF